MQIVNIEADLVRIPGWERFGWLRHGFSTRVGGVSTIYGPAELNLGWTKEDDPKLAAEHRRRFAGAVGGGMSYNDEHVMVSVG